jgi:hypothetical protein
MAKPDRNISAGSMQLAQWPPKDEKSSVAFTLNKSYKSKEGKWENTNFFRLTDLLDIILVCQAALDDLRVRKTATDAHRAEPSRETSDIPF